ncbi:hypothetical protein C2E23DRAFT_711718, partial [Lenzites betulinus]
ERKRVSDEDVIQQLSTQWNAISKEEQIAATDNVLEELKERNENLKKGTHTVAIQAFHDARATVESLEKELEHLHARTGIEALLFITRSTTSSYVQPFAFHTSGRLAEFVHALTNSNMSEFALKMEGYCLSGIQGVANNYVQGLVALKKDAASLINQKFQDVCVRAPTARLYYVNFEKRITERFGVVIENWPLKRFCSPGDICSRPELDVLISSWTSGSARFRSMSDSEWEAW